MSQRTRREGQRGQHIRLRLFCGGQHGRQNRNLVGSPLLFSSVTVPRLAGRVNAGNQARDPVSANDVEGAAHVVVDRGGDLLGGQEVKTLLVGTIRCDDRDRAASRTGIGAVVAGRQSQTNDRADDDRQDSDDVLAHAPHV